MKLFATIVLTFCTVLIKSQDTKAIESLYQKGDNVKVVEQGKKILEEYPDNLTANHLTGRALTDLNKFEEAIPCLVKASSETAPDWMKSWSHAYLGVCYYTTDEFAKSKLNLRKAVSLNATKNSTSYAEKRIRWFQMTEYFDQWAVIETPNIRFHIQPDHGIVNLEEYCNIREAAFIENNKFFEAKPYKKIDFYVWSKPEDGINVTGKETGYANSDLCIINSKIDQTTGHEITHILSDYGIKPTVKNRLINEGVAVAFDLTNRNRIELARSVNADNFGIKELMEHGEDMPESIIYPIGGALIAFLRGRATDSDLKSLIKEQTWENLIEVYGEKTIREFEAAIQSKK